MNKAQVKFSLLIPVHSIINIFFSIIYTAQEKKNNHLKITISRKNIYLNSKKYIYINN